MQRNDYIYRWLFYHYFCRYLACAESKRSGCKARAIIPVRGTADDLRLTQAHNHPPDENAAEREEFIKKLKEVVGTIPGSLRKIYEAIAEV